MRACFLGQNVTTLGFGVAFLQAPPLPAPKREDAGRDAVETPGPALPDATSELPLPA